MDYFIPKFLCLYINKLFEKDILNKDVLVKILNESLNVLKNKSNQKLLIELNNLKIENLEKYFLKIKNNKDFIIDDCFKEEYKILLEIIEELFKDDLEILSKNLIKEYLIKLYYFLIISYINYLQKFYETHNKIILLFPKKNKAISNRKEKNLNYSLELKNLLNLRNKIINILQYKILPLFLKNIKEDLLTEKSFLLDDNFNKELLQKYYTYVDTLSSLDFKLEPEEFVKLNYNSEILYFINFFNPCYNQLMNLIHNGSNTPVINTTSTQEKNAYTIFMTQFMKDPNYYLDIFQKQGKTQIGTAIIGGFFDSLIEYVKANKPPANSTVILNLPDKNNNQITFDDNKLKIEEKNKK